MPARRPASGAAAAAASSRKLARDHSPHPSGTESNVAHKLSQMGFGSYSQLPTFGHNTRASSASGVEKQISMEEERILDIVDRLEARESELMRRIKGLDKLWENRLKPLVTEQDVTHQEILNIMTTRELVRAREADVPNPPGPHCLRWVDGAVYQLLCSCVIIVNLGVMFWEIAYPHQKDDFWLAEQLFLAWYVAELLFKSVLYREQLLLGRISVVWWNYMDLLIVVTGVIDQWVTPLMLWIHHDQSGHNHHHANLNGLRALRLLRLFRLVRILKVLRIFLESDFAWTERGFFQTFIMCVIIFNSLIMGMELDYEWAGWLWIENTLLCIYLFELAVRIKRGGWRFFNDPADRAWNLLDFIIVIGGLLQQWILPLMMHALAVISGRERTRNETMESTMKMLRMFRLVRVARLARLLRSIKPLYRLMLGVNAAFHCMGWVVLLAIILLYAAALVFTDLVGHGELYGDDPPPEAAVIFGSVPQSMFMLFKVMNDDQSVVDPLLNSPGVKILFMIFMVVSNWCLLAILTSVICDNMISTSKRIQSEDSRNEYESKEQEGLKQLKALFSNIDTSGDGDADEEEFMKALQDPAFCQKLAEVSNLKSVSELQDLFVCLSYPDKDGKRKIRYADFVGKLQDGDKTATERGVLRVETKIRALERTSRSRFSVLCRELERRGELEPDVVFSLDTEREHMPSAFAFAGLTTPSPRARAPGLNDSEVSDTESDGPRTAGPDPDRQSPRISDDEEDTLLLTRRSQPDVPRRLRGS